MSFLRSLDTSVVVLFGSPPGKKVHLDFGTGGGVPEDAKHVSYVYGLTINARGKTPTYSLNGYYANNRTFPLAEAAEAQRRLEASEHFGKIVLEV